MVANTRSGGMADNPLGRCRIFSTLFRTDVRDDQGTVRHELLSHRSPLGAQSRYQPPHMLYSGAAAWRDAESQ